MTQAPIHPRHKDMALALSGSLPDVKGLAAHAQTLANLEAARADKELLQEMLDAERAERIAMGKALAEVHSLATEDRTAKADRLALIATIAAPYRASDPEIPSSERDPVPAQSAVVEPRWQTEGDMSAACPKCEAFRREVSDACELVDGFLEWDRNSEWKTSGDARKTLRHFIIPASDPVAEALKEMFSGSGHDVSDDAIASMVAAYHAFIKGDR